MMSKKMGLRFFLKLIKPLGNIKFNISFIKQSIETYEHKPSLLSNYKCYFSTLSKDQTQNISSFAKERNLQQNREFQQYNQQQKIIQQDFQNFIYQLQKLHQKDSQNYEKISSTIDKYINQKILSFYSQGSSENDTVVYFFQNQNLIQNYSTALNIKSSIQFRFRKYDEILTNIQNQIYLLKFLKLEQNATKFVQKLCNMYIFTLILNDHNKLKQIMKKDYSQIQISQEINSHLQEKKSGRRVSRKLYEQPKQKNSYDFQEDEINNKKKSQSSLIQALKIFMTSSNKSCLLTRALAYSIIGQVQKSLQIFCQLLRQNRENKSILGNFLSILIFFGNENFVNHGGRKYCPQKMREFIKNFLIKKEKYIETKNFPRDISPQDSEYLLNSVLSFLKDEPLEWTDLGFDELRQFFHPIYLIAQNYYLSGEKQKAIKMIEQLKKKVFNNEIKLVNQRKGRKLASKVKIQNPEKSQQKSTQFANVQMLIQFFQLMKNYDSKQYDKIKQMEGQFSQRQKKEFYKFQSVSNDILRSNIYQIFSQTYRDVKDNEKAQEYSQLSLGNHSVNNTYEINELGDIQSQVAKQQQKQQQERKSKKGIPPHYLNLRELLKIFQVRFQ